MANADEVMVQPTTTYMEGAEHKNERSEPYSVPRFHAEELKAQGFARIVEGVAPAGPEAPPPPPPAAEPDPPPPDPDTRPRGRRGSARD